MLFRSFNLSKEAIDKCLKSQANKDMLIKEVDEVSKCIVAGYYKIPFDGQYIKVESNLEKYFLSEKMIDGFLAHNKRHIEEKNQDGFNWKPKDENQIANCLRANAALCATDNSILVYNNKRLNETIEKHKSELDNGTMIDSYNKQIHKDKSVTLSTRINASNNTHIVDNTMPRSSTSGKGGTGHLTRDDGKTYCLDTGNTNAIEIIPMDYRYDEGFRPRTNGKSPTLTITNDSNSASGKALEIGRAHV